jgi:hypothetical protein
MTTINTVVIFMILTRDKKKIGEITLWGDVSSGRDGEGYKYYLLQKEMMKELEEKLGRKVQLTQLSQDNLDRVEVIFAV